MLYYTIGMTAETKFQERFCSSYEEWQRWRYTYSWKVLELVRGAVQGLSTSHYRERTYTKPTPMAMTQHAFEVFASADIWFPRLESAIKSSH